MKPPLIISGPNLPKGIQIDTPVYMQDLMPTTLELAGINIPSEIDFKSLLPVIKGQKTYSAIYGAYKDKQRMVRKDNMKLIWYPDSDTWLLFDLDNDSIECTNLADKPEYQAVLHDLKNTLINEQEKWGDPLLSGNFGNMKE